MNNFLEFIEEDIKTKEVLIANMPIRTKTDIKKYNAALDTMITTYSQYHQGVKSYLASKLRSFLIPKVDNGVAKLTKEIEELERVRFLLNPTNTYVEKIGFDVLLYEIHHYYELNFKSLDSIVSRFLNKFQVAGINLTASDFTYTVYVNEYMSAYLEMHQKQNKKSEKVDKIFENIYWVNPEIVEQIELNFRKLIKKHRRTFNNYIVKLQHNAKIKHNINNYSDCLAKLKSLYVDLLLINKETISDIVELSKSGLINISNYFEDSKFRNLTYENLTIDPINLKDSNVMNKLYDTLEKLKTTIEEYHSYLTFLPLFNRFQKEYQKSIPSGKVTNTKLKSVESKINVLETKLERLNRQITSGRVGIFKLSNEHAIKQLKMSSITMAKELHELYKTYDQEYFNNQVFSYLTKQMTVTDILHLYYSFDFFKKKVIKEVYALDNYDDITKMSESFDLYAMNLTNVISSGILVFETNETDKIIINKYRFDNINLNEDELQEDEIPVLLEKIKFLLRIHIIETSPITVEKIWFITQVNKIINENDPN